MKYVVSLCDLSGVMVAPWVNAGFTAVLVDPQHPEGIHDDGKGVIRVGHVVDHPATWALLRKIAPHVIRCFGFPVCTDLAVSGSVRFLSKREADIHFQAKAMKLVHECRVIGEMLGVPYFFENPVSVISSIYRKSDFSFHPYEFGGYLPEDDVHPLYPEYFPPRDAYGKNTHLWTGNGFTMPEKRPVEMHEEQLDGQGQSKAHNKLGGKSDRTKNIRSSTPRGFAEAVYQDYITL